VDLATSEFQGAFAEYTRVPLAALVRVPEGLPLRAAALAEPMAVALHAITRSGIQPGERALVTGSGPLGLLLISALRAHGIDDVVASEPAPERRARAERVGASVAVTPDELVSPPMPFSLVDEPFDAVFECSGNPKAMQSGLAQLRSAGTLVFVGTGMRRPKLDHNRILLNELMLTGAYNYDAGGFDTALALLASGRVPVDALIEPDDVSLEGLREAMDGLAAGKLAAKVMTVPKEAS
jgi:(R,R)-butanediol dehydrogenase/meso-butanediol dehydrogenase/diacetyl reductase